MGLKCSPLVTAMLLLVHYSRSNLQTFRYNRTQHAQLMHAMQFSKAVNFSKAFVHSGRPSSHHCNASIEP